VADVSGKGVAAALYMAVAKTLFRASVQPDIGPGDILARMNRELCRDNDQFIFVTAIVGQLSVLSGEVALADAGHNPALVVVKGRKPFTPEIPKCMALGVVAETPYRHGRFTLSPGETLVLHTDGATDARNLEGDLFGFERLTRAVETHAGKSAPDMISSISGDVETFVAGAPPEDDLTLLVLRYLGT
jgi:phosphoserine phosphatase RsbU/P